MKLQFKKLTETLDTDKISTYSTNAYYGQVDMVKEYIRDGETIGYIQYCIYEDEPHIQMIFVKPEYRRSGIGTALMKSLQSDFPNTNINVGYTTEDGTPFFNKITRTKKNPKYTRIVNELNKVNSRIKEIEDHYEYLYSICPDDNDKDGLEKWREVVQEFSDTADEELNDLEYKKRDLEIKLETMKKEFTYIK